MICFKLLIYFSRKTAWICLPSIQQQVSTRCIWNWKCRFRVTETLRHRRLTVPPPPQDPRTTVSVLSFWEKTKQRNKYRSRVTGNMIETKKKGTKKGKTHENKAKKGRRSTNVLLQICICQMDSVSMCLPSTDGHLHTQLGLTWGHLSHWPHAQFTKIAEVFRLQPSLLFFSFFFKTFNAYLIRLQLI